MPDLGANGEDEDIIFEPAHQSQEVTTRWHDPKHGWINGRQAATPDGTAISRLFPRIDLRFPEELPEVHIVTSFILRRQLRRRFAPTTLQLLLDKLPRLECMVYEPWRLWTGIIQGRYDREYKLMIEASLPKMLKRISLFEDFNDDYITSLQRSPISIFPIHPTRIPDPSVGAALASRSLDLEQLSVSYMADARHFFEARQPLWTWNFLQSLVLTSQLLTLTVNHRELSDLLSDAGVAALSMPRLHTMALWNGRKGEACAFIYLKEDNSITWRSTWDLDLQPHLIEAWESVASESTRSKLRVKKHHLFGDTIGSHGDAIYQLDLPCGVIDPVSLWQIRREGRDWSSA